MPEEPQPESKNRAIILSVDDSPVVQTTIKRALADRYHVLLASNAIDALSIMNQKEIALLLLDVTMPGVDGLEMCRTVRSIPKFRDLPIVMLTARDGFVDKIKGQIAGSTHYLTKPFHNEKLIEIVEKYVK
jgi:twitching motility two-component system response regulator PilG